MRDITELTILSALISNNYLNNSEKEANFQQIHRTTKGRGTMLVVMREILEENK